MKRFFRMTVFLLLVGGWALASASVHLLRTNDNIPLRVLTKDHLGYAETYADLRHWTLSDVYAHPRVINRLLDLRQEDQLLPHLKDSANPESLKMQLQTALTTPPPTQAVATPTPGNVKSIIDIAKHAPAAAPATQPQTASPLKSIFDVH